MVRNGRALREPQASGFAARSHAPIKNMLNHKVKEHGVSHGLAEVGYDIRLKQDILFDPSDSSACVDEIPHPRVRISLEVEDEFESPYEWKYGRFIIASAIEEFDMPNDLMGIVHDKSTWARKGLSVLNTVVEPGWKGFLTLELVYHGQEELHIPAGSGIAQVIFHELSVPAQYEGKYDNQADMPIPAKFG